MYRIAIVSQRVSGLLHNLPAIGQTSPRVLLGGRRRRTSVRRSRHGGRGLLERLQPFAADRKLEVGETGEVAAESRQVRLEAAPERIGHLQTIGSVVDCLRSCESTGELLAMRSRRAQRPPPRPLAAQAVGIVGRPAIIDAEVAAIHPAPGRAVPAQGQ